MPAQQRRRLQQERPLPPRRQLAERRQQDTIGRPHPWPPDLTPQDLQLMPQHQDLKLLLPLRTTQENQQLEQTASNPISERQTLKQQASSTHLPTLPARPTRVTPPSSAHSRRNRGTSLWDPHPGRRPWSPTHPRRKSAERWRPSSLHGCAQAEADAGLKAGQERDGRGPLLIASLGQRRSTRVLRERVRTQLR
jgi:hypothetical protein